MKRLLLALLVLFFTAQIPARSQQPESEAEKISKSTGLTEHGPNILWGWLNFLLLVGGLAYIAKKNAGPYFAKRNLEIRKGLIEAEAARAESEAREAEVNRRLANLQAEIEELRRSAKAEAEADADHVRRATAAEVAKIQQQIAEEVAAAGKSARLELRRYAAELALSLAEQKITARLSPETQNRLVKNFVVSIARTAPGIE
ncbi:MAG TPA: hypothetical protein VMT86_06675 [Bryobacteraceae bacterium]|nr:hypothetical protein [Bryobacteraceae bacterium]